MLEIFEKAEELSGQLEKSEAYIRFSSAKEELLKDADLYNRVGEYRRRNFALQNSDSNNKIDELRELENEYREILRNTVVREFLNSELILCRTIQKINDIIVERLDIDMNFM